jgi:hypothetical protein
VFLLFGLSLGLVPASIGVVESGKAVGRIFFAGHCKGGRGTAAVIKIQA